MDILLWLRFVSHWESEGALKVVWKLGLPLWMVWSIAFWWSRSLAMFEARLCILVVASCSLPGAQSTSVSCNAIMHKWAWIGVPHRVSHAMSGNTNLLSKTQCTRWWRVIFRRYSVCSCCRRVQTHPNTCRRVWPTVSNMYTWTVMVIRIATILTINEPSWLGAGVPVNICLLLMVFPASL